VTHSNGAVHGAVSQPELPGYERVAERDVCPLRSGRKPHTWLKLHDDAAACCTFCGRKQEDPQ
jgi:hypothetical protein